MAFAPPTTFVDGTVLTAAALEGNEEALRVYLHRGIIAGDLLASKWIDTRHIQPPEKSPFEGLQHGVTGYQGGQWAGGAEVRLTFATKFLSGNGRQSSLAVHHFPQSSFSLAIRRSAKLLFHYWWDLENGPDESTASYQLAEENRQVFIVPWLGNVNTALTSYLPWTQETRNNAWGLQGTSPIGTQEPYTTQGGYGSRQGTMAIDYNAVGTATFGLAIHSLTDRCGIVNWGVAVEAYYL